MLEGFYAGGGGGEFGEEVAVLGLEVEQTALELG